MHTWRIDMADASGVTSYTKDHAPARLRFSKLILATGAIERPIDFEGRTLPGVMSVGAVQLLLKSSAVAPPRKVVVVGNGPLTLLFTTQLVGLGVRISVLLDTAPRISSIRTALCNLSAIIHNRDKVWKRVRMLRTIRSAQIPAFPMFRALSLAEINGSGRSSSTPKVSLALLTLTWLVHEGLVPNTQHLVRLD
ncbi:NAD(P)/FAD-dependent oxidoreductase [Rhizobium mayense]|uniref:FAD/NAD(P)-binding oxidoreductase n=1 Tax=Rhizobium mayense TaxID=1312184 RepID=A0ABT7K352_9HYPH|nr:FAD/NAD(P)-binding oxidoreductase [Rhizobium mayense]MDL2403041.1 FAD/NAD(P)-binding oxidoreductase [Rhizobium mayense]